MTPESVRESISRGESLTTEFKLSIHDVQATATTLAAFANSMGGILIVGVNDDGTLQGVSDPAKIEAIVKQAGLQTSPPLECRLERHTIDQKTIVVAIVSGAKTGFHQVGDTTPRRYGTRVLASRVPPVALSVLIVDGDASTAGVLEALLRRRVQWAKVCSTVDDCRAALEDDRANAVFIDLFSAGGSPWDVIQFIQETRTKRPSVAFCLYSTAKNLAEMQGVDEYWRDRLTHYFRLYKDVAATALDTTLDGVLLEVAAYVLVARAKVGLGELKSALVQGGDGRGVAGVSRERAQRVVEEVEKALEFKAQTSRPIVPGVQTSTLDELVTETLQKASRSLQVTTGVNVTVLGLGAALVVGAFIYSCATREWQALAFGGLGMSGVIASLLKSPLHSIGSATRRILQVQVVYFSFLKQLSVIDQAGDSVPPLEKSKHITDQMERTLKAIEDNLSS